MNRLLSIVCFLSLVACASSQKQAGVFKESRHRLSFEAQIKIPETKDRLLKSPNNLGILIIAKKKDPGQASLLLENFTDTYFPRSCRTATLFADGVAVSLGEMKRSAARDGLSQAIATQIPRDGLAQLATPSAVTGEVCGIEFSLSETQVSSLRQMINATNVKTEPPMTMSLRAQ
jgi:hypothetical protein